MGVAHATDGGRINQWRVDDMPTDPFSGTADIVKGDHVRVKDMDGIIPVGGQGWIVNCMTSSMVSIYPIWIGEKEWIYSPWCLPVL